MLRPDAALPEHVGPVQKRIHVERVVRCLGAPLPHAAPGISKGSPAGAPTPVQGCSPPGGRRRHAAAAASAERPRRAARPVARHMPAPSGHSKLKWDKNAPSL